VELEGREGHGVREFVAGFVEKFAGMNMLAFESVCIYWEGSIRDLCVRHFVVVFALSLTRALQLFVQPSTQKLSLSLCYLT